MDLSMSPKKHLRYLTMGVTVWFLFWVGGLPDYYQQYSPTFLGVGSTLLSVAISYAALHFLSLGRAENRERRAFWMSFYYTVPLAILDMLYCGVYLGHGSGYLARYWYLTVFYLTPWLTFLPTARLLARMEARQGRPALPG